MTSHELARRLLELPELPAYHADCDYDEVSIDSVEVVKILDPDAPSFDCGLDWRDKRRGDLHREFEKTHQIQIIKLS